MALELAITGVFNKLVMGLTPMERLDALSKYNGNTEIKHWFILAVVIIVASVLTLHFSILFFKMAIRKISCKSADSSIQPNPDCLQNPDLPKDGSLSTEQIPLKKKIYIKCDASLACDYIDAELVENTPSGLTLQFNNPVEIIFGRLWVCRYYTGSFIAEFKTTVSKCSGLTVVLNHSKITVINRRRFLRVPVNQPAFIAKFPFKTETAAALSAKSFSDDEPANRTAGFETPRFVPAKVTELGGPGLRVTTSLNLKPGDRILLMFKLDHDQNIISSKVIEHIGFVRHIIEDKYCLAYAIELTGLHDDGINELIAATNLASIQMHKSLNADCESTNVQAQELVTV